MPEISETDLELFNKYKEIGEPDAIATELNAKADLERSNTLKEVASLSGYKESVLSKLADGLELKVEDGKAFVGDKPIEEYANENWEDFIPSLKEEKVNGVNFVRQASKSSAVNKLDSNVNSYLLSIYGKSSNEATVN